MNRPFAISREMRTLQWCNVGHVIEQTHNTHAGDVSKRYKMEAEKEKTFPVFRGANEAEGKKSNNLVTGVCSLCKKDIWIPELRCQCTETRSPEQVQKDTLQEQEEVELETQVRFNTKYPVLLQKNKVRPGVYQGKKGIPLRIKAEVWENIDSDEQGTKTIRETEKSDTVKVEMETEKKPVYETRAILDYQEWDKYFCG